MCIFVFEKSMEILFTAIIFLKVYCERLGSTFYLISFNVMLTCTSINRMKYDTYKELTLFFNFYKKLTIRQKSEKGFLYIIFLLILSSSIDLISSIQFFYGKKNLIINYMTKLSCNWNISSMIQLQYERVLLATDIYLRLHCLKCKRHSFLH